MGVSPALDLDLLRTLAVIAEEGSFTRAAERVGRTRSAVSLQLCEGGHEPPQWPSVEVWRAPLEWIISEEHPRHLDDPLPLSLGPGNCPVRPPWLDECIWRGAALRALQREERRYRIVSTSSSIAGELAAVSAGLAVSVANHGVLPAGLRAARPDEGLPELPEVALLLIKGREPRQPLTDALAAHIVETFAIKQHDA
jgi:DNA-binding transcriptional LysR family regulator